MIDLCQARTVPALADLGDVPLARLIDATTASVERYCRRSFLAADYDVLLPGVPTRSLFLPQYPVVSVSAVRSGPMPAIQIVHDHGDTQAATVECTALAVILTVIRDAAATTSTITYSAYPTLEAVSDRINTIASGWRATLTPRFARWASSDLAVYRGSQSARQITASLSPHFDYLTDYKLNPDTGELVRNSGWYGGSQAYRVQFRAGYSELPDDLSHAVLELAGATYRAGKTDPTLSSESLGGYSYTRASELGWGQLSLVSRNTLNSYKRAVVPYWKI